MLKYQSIQELVSAAEERGLKISELVLRDQAEAMDQTQEALYERMRKSFEVMRESVAAGQKRELRSMSGLTGGEGWRMKQYTESHDGGLCGSFLSGAIARALAVAGCNASMGLIRCCGADEFCRCLRFLQYVFMRVIFSSVRSLTFSCALSFLSNSFRS